jgi:benzoate-CoA ligase family protein
MKCNAADYFIDRHITEGRGKNIAIECSDLSINYQQLFESVNRAGNGFKKLQIQAGDRILLALPDIPEFFISFFGAIKIGAIPVPLSTLFSAVEYEYFLNHSRATIVIVHVGLLEIIKSIPRNKIPTLKHILVVGEAEDETCTTLHSFLEEQSSELISHPTNWEDVAFWMYSSGSTGAPKACVHLQHDMIIAAEQYGRKVLGITENDKCFSVSKLFFAYGLGNSLFCPLSVGATSILMAASPKPENIFNIIERHKPTLFFSVPSNYLRLLDHADIAEHNFNLSSIRIFTSAGERLPIKIFNRFKKRFDGELLDSMGATETFIFTANRPGANRPGSAGQIIPGYEAKIVDENGEKLQPGESGNLWVKSETVCLEYWGEKDKTEEAIHGDWFRTGDRCSMDQDGYLWYAGRADDMMKCNGAWVSPLEVESILSEHPSVSEVAVVGREDQNGLIKPSAYIVLRGGYLADAKLFSEINAFVAEKIPHYKRPQEIYFVDNLPRTVTGKIQRFKLQKIVV